MAWWAPWTWVGGNKEETEEGLIEEQAGPPPSEETWPSEFQEEEGGASSWWRPWTWYGRRGTEGLEDLEAGLPLEEELSKGARPYSPTAQGPELERGRPATEEVSPRLERKRPPREVLVEEEELEGLPPEEEGYPGGLYISDRKIEGGFKKFCLALFSIFLLPFILVFGIGLSICVFLLIFPILIAFFPIFFVGLSMILIIVPAAVPVLIIYIMVTERSLLLINSRGHLFSLQRPPAEEKKMPGE
ncbi:MAG TPA: hypothetical protein ACFYED_12345 [Candidatus Tripitaka californicus]|uniref:hypothetical protein n=1 Tax=Candidatus Tripitaka californicus TaxID=3367616 RepID=UPI0040251CFB|nr:hypothetical protein [Planctomycetota bacterium]